jgi:hypothetical protein
MTEFIHDPYMSYPIKDNIWHKNNVAHIIMRAKKIKNNDYCAHCCHHRCGDPTKVYGNRSLKKSKVVSCNVTKYADKCVLMPDFLSIKNGETTFVDYDME